MSTPRAPRRKKGLQGEVLLNLQAQVICTVAGPYHLKRNTHGSLGEGDICMSAKLIPAKFISASLYLRQDSWLNFVVYFMAVGTVSRTLLALSPL